jgi:hypothetical protein
MPISAQRLRSASHEFRQFVRETLNALLSQPRFEDYLPGLQADHDRANVVLERLKSMAS